MSELHLISPGKRKFYAVLWTMVIATCRTEHQLAENLAKDQKPVEQQDVGEDTSPRVRVSDNQVRREPTAASIEPPFFARETSRTGVPAIHQSNTRECRFNGPSYLENGMIFVYVEDGSVYPFESQFWKVVPREPSYLCGEAKIGND